MQGAVRSDCYIPKVRYNPPPKGTVVETIMRCALETGHDVRLVRAVLAGAPIINRPRRDVDTWLLENLGAPGVVVPTHLEAASAGPTKRGRGQPKHASTDMLAAMKKLAAAIGQAQ